MIASFSGNFLLLVRLTRSFIAGSSMVMLFVAWDDGSGVGMILNGCEEFCETSIELDVSYLYSVLGDRMDLLSVKNESF